MPPDDEDEFNAAYAARVRQLRIEADYTIEQMAKLIHIHKDTYRTYETGKGTRKPSPLPPHLIERFALAVRTSIEFVITGKGKRHLK